MKKNKKEDKCKDNQINYKKEDLELTSNMKVNIPLNFFESSIGNNKNKDVFNNNVKEKRELEQYFWTSKTVKDLLQACEYISETCCFTTPSLAHEFHINGREEKLLDLDDRFNYLPRFEKFDIKNPHNLDEIFNIIVIDPPFFNITTKELFDATNIITKNNYSTNIIIAYLKRYEYPLLETFKLYGISETNLMPEYAHIKENKWRNFKIYSNIDLPNMKRIPGKYGYKKNT
jgi:hypothetical protein